MSTSTLYTLDSSSFYKTGQYYRTNIFGNTTYAIALGGSQLPNNNGPISQSGYGLTVKSGTYTSGGGEQFVVINRTATANNVTIDVGNSTFFNPDGNDIVCIETGDHSSKDPGNNGGAQSATFVNFNNSKIDVGKGNNLVALGTDTSTSATNTAKFALTGTKQSITFNGFTAAGSKGAGQAPLKMDNSKVISEGGNDTLVTTTTNDLSVTTNSLFNSGDGSDVVFFASSINGKSILGGGNTIQLSAAGGTKGDGVNDSLIINGGFDTAKFTAGSKVTVTGFDYNKDKIYFSGSVYSTIAEIAGLNASKNFIVSGS
ncbi:MAG: hypothetical protein NTY67_00780 [Cyanobacteria bacterium]|nr:hypothetical protein [Cyanobacteriota bacterium]